MRSKKQRRLRGMVAAGLGATILGQAIMDNRRLAELRGQVVLIMGSSRGLGFELATQFADAGCRIAICARGAETLERARQALQDRGVDVFAMPCDVSDLAQVEAMIAATTQHFGQIDILVNNAATITVGPLQTLGVADFEEAQHIIFWGMVYATLTVLPQMRERRSGRIVNVTSIGGKLSVPHLLPYSTAKAAAISFSEGLRAELAGTGITVTTIVPGLMRTGAHVHATYAGDATGEYKWFTTGELAPLTAIHPSRAARAILHATVRGSAERILSFPAQLGALVHGILPGFVTDLLGLVNRFGLPAAPQGWAEHVNGKALEGQAEGPLLHALAQLNQPTAQRLNQNGER
ncbi:MAG: SDR family NAD(P)-dependent oxidoreductase [Herpetosiphonaceae bacterium]|nr:SDR family NAD(P)-dependent oxidoreductase [Herpetosiphonaceae bacterium]